MNQSSGSPSSPLKPIKTDAVDSVLSMEEEYSLGGSLIEPRRIRLPKTALYAFIALAGVAIIALAIWALAQSTWTYGTSSIDPTTTARLAQVRDKLAVAGAPQAALQQLALAAQPNANIGDAIEALVNADQALESASDNPSIAEARQELRIILSELESKRYSYDDAPSTPWTPLPTLGACRRGPFVVRASAR